MTSSDQDGDAHVPDPQLQTCPFSPFGSFEPQNLIGWQRKLWGDELLPLADLCDRLRDSRLGGNSLRVRIALVTTGPEPLAITVDPEGPANQFYVLHGAERVLSTLQPEYMAWLVRGLLVARSREPGESS